ncbi:hypothetical protein V2H45_09480 [Tumidithrix elongata RA019]|uniref:Helix-turn-helix domain-containing protein n=1 Tax=Tumidithrix elongata BACA0141 TaxID=2716417 RepID=A0AAW9PS12_9CYAN|nr:hypothetical protein [Tumidithrix elongata RA019]
MSIIKVNHERNFTQIDNETIRDRRLSFKARGLLTLLLSYPHNWEIYVPALVEASEKDGEEAVRTGLKELETLGYLYKQRVKDACGKFRGWMYVISETANSVGEDESTETVKTTSGKTERGKTASGKSGTKNTYRTNTELTNTLSSPTPSQLESQAERENFDRSETGSVPAESVPEISDSQGEDLSAKAQAIGEDNFSAPAPQPKISNFESAGAIAQSLTSGQKQSPDSPQIVTVTVESKDEDGNKTTSHVQLDITDPDYRTWIVGYCIRKMPDQPERDSLNEDLLVSSLARKPETQRRYVQHCQKLAERAEIERLAPIQPVHPPPAKFATIGSKCAMLQAKWMLPQCRNAAIAQAQELGFEVTDTGIALPAYADPETLLDKWEAF